MTTNHSAVASPQYLDIKTPINPYKIKRVPQYLDIKTPINPYKTRPAPTPAVPQWPTRSKLSILSFMSD